MMNDPKKVTLVRDYDADWAAFYDEDDLQEQGHISYMEDRLLEEFGITQIDADGLFDEDTIDTGMEFPSSLEELKYDLSS